MYSLYHNQIYFCSVIALFLLCSKLKAQQLPTDSSLWQMELDTTVVVSGSFLPIGQAESLYKIRVIDEDQIERQAALRLDELLQQQLNIRQVQDGVLGTRASLQGLSGKYVQVLVDGVPVVGRNGGQIDMGRISLQNIKQVEIVEGPMSTVYGNNALAGTINIITKKYQGSQLEGQFAVMAERVGRYNAQAELAWKWKKLGLRLNYEYLNFDGFSTDTTIRAQTWDPKIQHHFGGVFHWQLSPENRIDYRIDRLSEQINDFGIINLAQLPELAYAYDSEYLTTTLDHQLVYKGRMKDDYYWNTFIAFNEYERQKNQYNRPLLNNTAELKQDSINSDTTYFYAGHARLLIASAFQNKWNFQAGVDLRHEWAAGARLEDSATIGDYAALANLRWIPINTLKVQLGLRYAYNTRYMFPLVGNVNVYWNPSDEWILRASYARGFRAPSLKELYLDFVDINHFIKGNPNLNAENSHHYRLAVDFQKYINQQNIKLSTTIFYNHIFNQIGLMNFEEDSTGIYQIAEGANRYTYFNLEEFKTLGGELNCSYSLGNFRLDLATVITGRFNPLTKEYETINPFSYTVALSQQIQYRLPNYGWTFSLFRKDYDKLVRYGTIYNPIRQANEVTEYFVQGYGIMDFSIQKSFFNKNLKINGGVKNILNVTNVNQAGGASTHGAGSATLPVGMGRVFFVQLNYKFAANLSDQN